MNNVNLQNHNNPKLLPEGFIERAKTLSTPLLSDMMGCFGAMDYTIKPVNAGMKLAGTAITVNLRAGDNLFLHNAVYNAARGYVLVIDGKGHTKNAPLGEIISTAALSVGLEGIVLDGVARDSGALKKLGLPIFCKGFIPTGGDKDGPGEMNIPISCGGVPVQPGDLILGDEDGVVVVPRDRVEEVLMLAEKKLLQEESRLKAIAEGNIKPSWLQQKLAPYNL